MTKDFDTKFLDNKYIQCRYIHMFQIYTHIFLHPSVKVYVKSINLRSLQDLVDFVMGFRKEDLAESTAHPAQLVVDILGNKDESNRLLHCSQLEAWFQEYSNVRAMPNLYKKPGFESGLTFHQHFGELAIVNSKCFKIV